MARLVAAQIAVVGLVLIAINAGCTSSPVTPDPGLSLKNDVLPILFENCIICHQGTNPPGGLSLEPALVYSQLVNANSTQSTLLRVEPGAPDDSYLVHKLNGTQLSAGGSGDRMPFGRPPLQQEKIDLITRWISAGSLDN